MTPNELLVQQAAKFVGVIESNNDNRGKEVEMFQKSVGLRPGDAYCMAFAQYNANAVSRSSGIANLLTKSGSSLEVWRQAPETQRFSAPAPGLIAIWKHIKGNGGHTGIVESVNSDGTFRTIEGNTSVGNNREGVGYKTRHKGDEGDLRLVGFVNPFNTNIIGGQQFTFSDPISQAIKQASSEHGVAENVMRAFAHIESGGKTGLESKTGVRGLFQITEDTWKRVTGGQAYSKDPLEQSRVASRLVSNLSKQFGGNLDLVAVAYNAGPKVAEQAQKYMKEKGWDAERASWQATLDVGYKGGIFSDKTIQAKFGGNRVDAVNKKADEVNNYIKKFRSALGGVDFHTQRSAEIYTKANLPESAPGGQPSEKDENVCKMLFTEKFSICGNAMEALASNPRAAPEAVKWMQEHLGA